jgi:prolyl 4-hydroxylase
MKRVDITPEVFVIENFYNKEECHRCIEWSEQQGYEEAKVNIHGQQVMMKNIRNNSRVMFKDETLATGIFEKIKPFVPQQIGLAKLLGLNELFRFYKYEPGQQFKRHRDGSYQRNEKEFSLLTLLIYLNEAFEGGATSFTEAVYQPTTGAAMVFPHFVLHQGDALVSGVKYVLRTDIMYQLP